MEERSSDPYFFRNDSKVAFARLLIISSFRLLDEVQI